MAHISSFVISLNNSTAYGRGSAGFAHDGKV